MAVAREAGGGGGGGGSSSWQPLFSNDTAGGKQGATGEYFLLFPDMSSILHSQNEWFIFSGSDIYL